MVQIKDASFMHAPNHNMNVVTSSNGQMTPILVMMGGGLEHLGAQHLEGEVQVGCYLF
jgi:hypothetical protein